MMRPWPEAHRIAAVKARRAHRDLAIDVSRRVDPFAALEAAGVVVMRQRLDHLAGLYLPGDPADGSPPGVLINSAHPSASSASPPRTSSATTSGIGRPCSTRRPSGPPATAAPPPSASASPSPSPPGS